MKKAAITLFAITLLNGTQAFAADMPLKAPPPAPPNVLSWTGFYAGVEFGVGWSNEAVNYSGNDGPAALLLAGALGLPGEQPVANGYRIPQSGPVGGLEAGYNWQVSNWILGLGADFSLAGMSGQASGTSIISSALPFLQTSTAKQGTDWYGTIRGRAGWLATPNLLLFGTGGFAYGRLDDSANYATTASFGFGAGPQFVCTTNLTCFAGSSSATRTGWTAGGGAEALLDDHWSFKIEYQFVDLGTETVRITATAVNAPGTPPSSFNAVFHDRFNVVRVALNYRF